MADVTQVTFDETDLHHQVMFQKGRDVLDSELNELGSILRVLVYRALQAAAGEGWSAGCRVTATGAANQVRVGLGTLLGDGVSYRRTANTDVAMPAPPGGGTRTDRLYLRIQETEIDDPNPLSGVGVLSRRRQLDFDFVVAEGTTLTSTGNPWEGAIHYLLLATVLRTAGAPVIVTNDITHSYRPTPLAITTQVTEVVDGQVGRINGGTQGILETDLRTLTVDVAEGSTTNFAETFRVRFNRDSLDEAVGWTFHVNGTITANEEIRFDDTTITLNPVRLGDTVDTGGRGLRGAFGEDTYNVAANQSGSMLRRLNGKFSASIGNGTTSFGDYNGSGAIQAAATAATTAGYVSLHLHLKEGTHIVTNTVDLTGFDEATLEGEGEIGTFVSNSHATNPTLEATRLILRDLAFVRSSTATVAVEATTVFAQRVRFTNLSVETSTSSEKSAKFEACRFVPPTAKPCVTFGANTSLTVEFSLCYFTAVSAQPVISGGTSGPEILRFRGCEILYGAYTGASDSGVIAPSAAPASGTWWTSFEDCVFTQPAAEACVQLNTDLERLTYDRCKFIFTNDNATLPFAAFYAQYLTVRNCSFDTGDYAAGVDSGEGSAISFDGSKTVEIRDVTVFRGNARLFPGTVVSTGRLALVSIQLDGAKGIIDGLQVDYRGVVNTGTDTVARQLIYVYGDSSTERASLDLSNARVVYTTEAVALCTQAAIRVAGTFQSAVVRGATLRFGNVAQIGSGVSAIMLGGPSTDDIDIGGSITVADCYIERCNGSGITDLNNSATLNIIDRCRVVDTSASLMNYPISARDNLLGYVHVHACHVELAVTTGINLAREVALARGNYVRNTCSGGSVGSKWQIWFGPTSVVSLICVDNTCLSSGGTPLEIGVDNAAAPVVRTTMKGFDTLYDSTPTEVFTVGTFGVSQPMLFNVANIQGV